MKLSKWHLYCWMAEVKTQLVKAGVNVDKLTNMKGSEAEEMEEVMMDMFHGNFHPAIVQPMLPVDHVALMGPLNVANHLKEVFFD